MAHSDAATERARPEDLTAATPRPLIDIGEAIEQGWLEVWYQPKIDLKRKCLAGAEALTCIRHPDGGLLMPGDFTCAAPSDLARLTESALKAALRSWSLFEDAGFNLGLAINVQARVLLNLPVRELVAAHRPASDRWPGIILQVTEDEIVRDPKLGGEITAKLRGGGIKLAIDNFGAGYSSLASLRELQFVEIKLDQSFVRDCATDATNGAICQTAIDLAHRFGSAATAEGIESQVDLQALMTMGCDFGQGALISPPMAEVELLDLLRQRVTKPRPQSSPVDAPHIAGIINKVA
jgi:EAL domain-containing protein (putative c-di-GMP-specific phosphodiesterase class I)